MPLNVLQGIDAKIADGALAAAALSIGNAESDPVPERYRDLSKAIIEEAAQAAGVSHGTKPALRDERIRAYLSGLIRERLLSGVDIKAIGDRLGTEGRLPLGAYDIGFSQAFKSTFKRESKKVAELCVVENDMLEHVFAPAEYGTADDQTSLFAKRIRSINRKRSYWAIVEGRRKDDSIVISNMFRVFPEVVRNVRENTALALFEAFTRAYASPFKIGDQLFNEGFYRFDPPRPLMGTEISLMHDDDDKVLTVAVNYEPTGIEATLAWSINLQRYWRDWAKYA